MFESLVTDLVAHRYAVADNAISESLYSNLESEFDQLHRNSMFQNSKIRGANKTDLLAPAIRGDSIYWIESDQSPTQKALIEFFEELRIKLNQELYLGLQEFEAHYAFYPAQSLYQKHVDRFRKTSHENNEDARMISLVLYLNRSWQESDGGKLKIYAQSGAVEIEPLGNRLVCFMSSETEHEVLKTNVGRKSIAAWFKTR
jgi:SM-20-related protein